MTYIFNIILCVSVMHFFILIINTWLFQHNNKHWNFRIHGCSIFKLLSRKVLCINWWKDNWNCWKVDYFLREKGISRKNYSKIVGTWNFQCTFETRKRSFINAFSICMTVPIKHVKLIIFENYHECKTKHLFLIKKSSNTIWQKKNSDMAEKEHWWREESFTACPKEEEPISEDSKKTLSLRTRKRILSMKNLKEDPYYCET